MFSVYRLNRNRDRTRHWYIYPLTEVEDSAKKNGSDSGTLKCVVHKKPIQTQKSMAADHHGRHWDLTMYYPEKVMSKKERRDGEECCKWWIKRANMTRASESHPMKRQRKHWEKKKQHLKVGTWNVRTLYQLDNLRNKDLILSLRRRIWNWEYSECRTPDK